MTRQKGVPLERVVTEGMASYFERRGFKASRWEALSWWGRPDLLVYLPDDRILLFEVKMGPKGDHLQMLSTYAQLQRLKEGIQQAHPSAEVTEAVVTNEIVGEYLADSFEKSGVRIIQIQDENDNLDEKLAPLLSA